VATARVEIPPKLIPVFSGEADVRGAYGGRGSAKTRTFAKMSAVRAYIWAQADRRGIILCGRQYMNALDDSSLEEVKLAILSEPWLAAHFDIGEKYVRTKCGRVEYKFAGLDRNISSVRSKSRILLCWVDEAEPVTEQAWVVLVPTLREEDSELWVTWNPELDGSATDKRFRKSTDPRYKVMEMNWRDNPAFPDKLERDRQRDLEERPELYDHIWEGSYKSYVEGAYYMKSLTRCKEEGRIGKVTPDPHLPVKAFIDIGGTGAKSDAFAMWIVQFVAREIRVLDYYEAQGQPLATHLTWMRNSGYGPQHCEVILPHDGSTHDRVYDVTYESAFRGAGYRVQVIPNQGRGAAAARVEAVRKLFPQTYFNESTTESGRKALGYYHEKRDEIRNIGLGPEHDWSSHGADAFGLMAVAYKPPRVNNQPRPEIDRSCYE